MCYRGQDDVDLWAPGGQQTTLGIADPTHYNECPASTSGSAPLNSGNSLAIPHVAGVAALVVRVDPTLCAAAVGRLLRETAETQVNAAHRPSIRVLNAFDRRNDADPPTPEDSFLIIALKLRKPREAA